MLQPDALAKKDASNSLQFWQLRTWIHDNLCDLTIKTDTGLFGISKICSLPTQNCHFQTQEHIFAPCGLCHRLWSICKLWNSQLRLTHCSSAEGVVCVCWGRNLVLARHTKGSMFGPTLSRRPVWHMDEHPPKLGTVSGISDATECLEEKHSYINVCVSLWYVKYGSFYFRWSPLKVLQKVLLQRKEFTYLG